MAQTIIGGSLSVLTKMAGSTWLDKLGLRKLVERISYVSTKNGFKVATTVARTFKSSGGKNGDADRLSKPSEAGLFDLSLTDEQQMIRDNIRRFAADVLTPAAEAADENEAVSDEIILQAAELGLNYFAVPESLGGAATERSVLTNVLIAEDLGHGDMGMAAALLAPIGVANALTQWGTAEQQAKYLPAFLDEKPLQATIAVNEMTAAFDANNLSTTATKTASGYVLNGVKTLVLLSKTAELFLVAASTAGSGSRLFIVEGGAAGLSVESDSSMGLKAATLGKLTFENVELSADALLGDDSFDYQTFLSLSQLAWGALSVGTGQAVLDYVIPYCNERVAFGEPISHRQSVAFMIANIGIELEVMRLSVLRAASRFDQGLDFSKEAFSAKYLCTEKGMEIGTNGVQLLGGHGFTKEFPVERWYRNIRAMGIVAGGIHL